MIDIFIPLPLRRFAIIYADPPWHYGNGKLPTNRVSTSEDWLYTTTPTAVLKKLPVRDIAERNSLLFMWSTDSHLKQAIQLGEAWGFTYTTVAFVWHKGMRHMVGPYTMKQVEQCLLFRRGNVPQPRGARNLPQFLMEVKREHSRKPDTVRDSISAMFPMQSKIELFARGIYPGWDVWGNQVPTPANDNFLCREELA